MKTLHIHLSRRARTDDADLKPGTVVARSRMGTGTVEIAQPMNGRPAYRGRANNGEPFMKRYSVESAKQDVQNSRQAPGGFPSGYNSPDIHWTDLV